MVSLWSEWGDSNTRHLDPKRLGKIFLLPKRRIFYVLLRITNFLITIIPLIPTVIFLVLVKYVVKNVERWSGFAPPFLLSALGVYHKTLYYQSKHRWDVGVGCLWAAPVCRWWTGGGATSGNILFCPWSRCRGIQAEWWIYYHHDSNGGWYDGGKAFLQILPGEACQLHVPGICACLQLVIDLAVNDRIFI